MSNHIQMAPVEASELLSSMQTGVQGSPALQDLSQGSSPLLV